MSRKILITGIPQGSNDVWRGLDPAVESNFAIAPELVERFNAWREVTLTLPCVSQIPAGLQSKLYRPLLSGSSLEAALRNQMDWITAWRIDRYAFSSLESTDFFRSATNLHVTVEARSRAQAERNKRQTQVESRRELQLDRERRGAPKKPLEPGVKNFDPDNSKTQLREAAEEFGKIYRDLNSDPYLMFFRRARWRYGPAIIIYWNSADKMAEHLRMKEGGQTKVSQLFPPPLNQRNHTSETTRGSVDENRNRDKPEGLLRALFDNHVHDARAWFVHALLNGNYMAVSITAGREPWGSYFTERMVFFGETNRRDVAIIPTSEKLDAVAKLAESSALMDSERRLRVQQEIRALWEKHHAGLQGRENA